MSTLDSLNDDGKSSNQFDFSPMRSKKSANFVSNNFNKKYGKMINDFNLQKGQRVNDFNTSSSYFKKMSSNRTFSCDEGEKLKLKAIQSQLETKKSDQKKEFSTKLKDLKLDYFTKNNNTISTNDYTVFKKSFQKNDLLSDKMKIKIGDFIKKTNEFSIESIGSTDKSTSKNYWKEMRNKGDVKTSLMKEFKLFDNSNSKNKFLGTNNYSSGNVINRKFRN